MALVKPAVLQIVGYKNSGKTTFISKLTANLKSEGINVVTIKHHGHGGKPYINEKADSTRHLDSGASATLVEGEGRILLQAERTSWTLAEQIKLLSYFEPDVILIEGFKRELYPKLVLIRDKSDEELLTTLANVTGTVFWEKRQDTADEPVYPSFHIHDNNALNWVIKWLKNKLNEENS